MLHWHILGHRVPLVASYQIPLCAPQQLPVVWRIDQSEQRTSISRGIRLFRFFIVRGKPTTSEWNLYPAGAMTLFHHVVDRGVIKRRFNGECYKDMSVDICVITLFTHSNML